MEQIAQVVGAVLILAAFSLAQVGRMRPADRPYLVLNLVGAGVLAVVAAADRDYGFLLLESVWAAVSAVALARSLMDQGPAAANGPPTP